MNKTYSGKCLRPVRLTPAPSNGEKFIADLTDEWCYRVTEEKNAARVAGLFCADGSLIGTVSTTLRGGNQIYEYFRYFAELPGLVVLNSNYHITHVSGNVWLNTAFITWWWQGLEDPLVARMTFLYRGVCLFQLHSSALPLPEKNTGLLNHTNA